MSRKEQDDYLRHVSLMSCWVPKGFLLRFHAMQVIRGDDKGALIAGALENEIEKWESRLSDKDAALYKSILETKAKQNGLYLRDLTASLSFVRTKKGLRKLSKVWRDKSPWPKIKKS